MSHDTVRLYIDSNGYLIVTFDYRPDRVAKMKRIPGATYSAKLQEWAVPLTAESYCKFREITGLGLAELDEQLLKKEIDLREFRFKTKPFAHQKEALELVLNHFGFLVNLNMMEEQLNGSGEADDS